MCDLDVSRLTPAQSGLDLSRAPEVTQGGFENLCNCIANKMISVFQETYRRDFFLLAMSSTQCLPRAVQTRSCSEQPRTLRSNSEPLKVAQSLDLADFRHTFKLFCLHIALQTHIFIYHTYLDVDAWKLCI